MTHKKIIFVTLDGFRKDKVDFCPTLKSYADESIVFSNMMTVAPYTLAAHHAMFSGMYPSRNGVNAYYNMFRFKKNEIQTIPQFLSEIGFYTCCDIINDVVIPTEGFDEVNIFDEKTVDFKKHHSEVIEKISSHDKFFLFLHYTEPHKNYVVDIVQKYKDKENKDEYFAQREENDKRYTSYMFQLDEYVKTILQTIRDCKIEDETIVIFEELFEKYSQKIDFIQKYIFPGGMLPTVKTLENIAIEKKLDFFVKNQMADSYHQTLEIWRQNFNHKWDTIKHLGYSNEFKRMWNFYLSYCSGGFKAKTIDVFQIDFTKKQ